MSFDRATPVFFEASIPDRGAHVIHTGYSLHPLSLLRSLMNRDVFFSLMGRNSLTAGGEDMVTKIF